jgi:putative SbcD/Mre11-related phosphoesterase
MNIIRPVINEPALVIEQNPTSKVVLIADLHLGIELTFLEKGVQIPSSIQTNRLSDRLLKILNRIKPSSLIILGDVKHNIPAISNFEWQIIPTFFEKFGDLPIHIITGNHESMAQIEGLTTRNIIIHPAEGWILDVTKNNIPLKIGLFHGHTWPGKDLFNTDILIMAHSHPVIEFKDEFNVRTYEPAWIRAYWDKTKLATAYLKYLNVRNAKNPVTMLQEKFQTVIADHPEILIVPAFNDLLGGSPFNSKEPAYIGPLLKSDCINIDEAEAILLDGTIMGKIKEIRLND